VFYFIIKLRVDYKICEIKYVCVIYNRSVDYILSIILPYAELTVRSYKYLGSRSQYHSNFAAACFGLYGYLKVG